jgi:hypothetical protein
MIHWEIKSNKMNTTTIILKRQNCRVLLFLLFAVLSMQQLYAQKPAQHEVFMIPVGNSYDTCETIDEAGRKWFDLNRKSDKGDESQNTYKGSSKSESGSSVLVIVQRTWINRAGEGGAEKPEKVTDPPTSEWTDITIAFVKGYAKASKTASANRGAGAALENPSNSKATTGISVGADITVPRKGARIRGKVVGMDEKFVKVEYKAGAGKHGNVTQSIPRERFQKMVFEGEIVPVKGLYKYLIENRPGYRKGVENKVWEQAKARGNGKVIDPLTKKELTWDRTRNRTDQWDMGHKYGMEYRVLVRKRANEEITQEQFLNEYNKPENYQPEHPVSNRSHAGEKK